MPTLYPREWEVEHFLNKDPWLFHLKRHVDSNTPQVSSTEEEHYKHIAFEEMVSPDHRSNWVSISTTWFRWILTLTMNMLNNWGF